MGDYFRPHTLSELNELLKNNTLTVIAGGTDFYPARVGKALDEDILDITAVPELSGVQKREDGWSIGAATRWSEIVSSDLPPVFDGLKAAACEVGGRQIQNSGTLGGNLCNASPAADGVPALLALNATAEIAGRDGNRTLPLSDFILGNRKIALQGGEILKSLHIPDVHSDFSRSDFMKLGSRKYLVISLVMISGVLGWSSDGRIQECRISVGACSEVAIRLDALEQALIGSSLNSDLRTRLEDSHLDLLSPIDDVRASGDYRKEAARTLVERLLKEWSARA